MAAASSKVPITDPVLTAAAVVVHGDDFERGIGKQREDVFSRNPALGIPADRRRWRIPGPGPRLAGRRLWRGVGRVDRERASAPARLRYRRWPQVPLSHEQEGNRT